MGILDLLFDRRCKLCGLKIFKGSVCDMCKGELEQLIAVRKRQFRVDGRIIEGRYIFEYENETVKRLLFALKRSSDRGLFEYAAGLYERSIGESFSGFVTFAPRRPVNVRYYGYDHVKEPVKRLCKQNEQLKFCNMLKRRGFSENQKELSGADRAKNVENVFRVIKNDIPKNIVLVDDVVTTGNTVCACAGEILKKRRDVNISFAFLTSRDTFTGIG